MTSTLMWFRSTYSSNDGPDCVEVALDWFKSTYSGNDGPECVEVAITPATIHIRDSKDKDGARLAVAGGSWVEFLRFAVES
ncbi:DUF397 domain-containing protein [Streptomyces sp. NPDC007971]|uniref:DUF397 domain-containing protein n=1 Tax=Streptomyces sp. NPDC007971 TaxID=3364799 RepID=UPI0036EE63D7